jgi:hypothetical protein
MKNINVLANSIQNIKLILISGLFLFTSCHTELGEDVIFIDLENNNSFIKFNEVVDSIKTIILENSCNESFIGSIDQIVKADSLLFILDKRQNSLFIFAIDGTFINRINENGRGPGEFLSLTTFGVDVEKQKIYIFDIMQYKLLTMKFDGTVIREHITEDIFRNICVLENGNLLVISSDYSKHERHGVWEASNCGSFLKSYSTVDKKNILSWTPFPSYSIYDNCITYSDVFSSEIFTITNNKKERLLRFNLKQKLPEHYFSTEFALGMREGIGPYFLNNRIAESKDVLFLRFLSHENGSKSVLINKQTNNLALADSSIKELKSTFIEGSWNVFNYDSNALIAVSYVLNQSKNPKLKLVYFKEKW